MRYPTLACSPLFAIMHYLATTAGHWRNDERRKPRNRHGVRAASWRLYRCVLILVSNVRYSEVRNTAFVSLGDMEMLEEGKGNLPGSD